LPLHYLQDVLGLQGSVLSTHEMPTKKKTCLIVRCCIKDTQRQCLSCVRSTTTIDDLVSIYSILKCSAYPFSDLFSTRIVFLLGQLPGESVERRSQLEYLNDPLEGGSGKEKLAHRKGPLDPMESCSRREGRQILLFIIYGLLWLK